MAKTRNLIGRDIVVTFVSSLFLMAGIFLPVSFSSAADISWTGTTSSDWATATNWSTGVVPTSADNVTIPDAATTANDPSISAGAVVGSVTVSANGILNGNAQTISVYGHWTNSGTFNHGNGKIVFTGSDERTFTPGSSQYYDIELNKNLYTIFMTSGTATVAGNFTHTRGQMRNGQFNLAGNYIIGASAGGAAYTSTVINLNAATDQQIIYTAGGAGAQVRVDKAGGTLTIASDIVVNGWNYIQGTVTGLDTYTLIFGDDEQGYFTPGSLTYNNIELRKTGTDILMTSGTATISGNFTHTDGQLRDGQFNLAGNYIIGALAGGAAYTSTIINFNSAGDQQIIHTAGGVGGQIRVDKAGGTLTIPDNLVINGWIYVQGTVAGIDANTLIFGDNEYGYFTPGSLTYNNIELNKTQTDSLITSGTATISGNFTHTDGQMRNGQFNLAGNYIIGAAANGGTYTSTIVNLNSAADQQIVYAAGGVGTQVRIDKASGALTISSDLTLNGWTYIQGTVVGTSSYILTFGDDENGSFTPGALTYKGIAVNKTGTDDLSVSSGTLNISGDLTVTDGEIFFNANNTTVNVSGSVTITATGNLYAGTNPITVNGNWTNNGTFSHGNGKVVLAGSSANSTFTPGASAYNNIDVNKAGGNFNIDWLYVSGTATVNGSLNHIDGRLMTGQINLAGNYTVGSAASAGQNTASTIINFNHASNNQTIVYNAGGEGAEIRIDKAGGIFSITSDINVNGWEYIAGTVTGADVYTITFGGWNGNFIPGNLTYANIAINKTYVNGNFDWITVTGTANVSGNINHINGRMLAGQINLAGNYIIGAAASAGQATASTIINFNHASNAQAISYTAGGEGAHIRIDKAGGTFSISSDINVSGWEYISGTVSGTNTYSITFGGWNDTFTPGSLTYSSIAINKTYVNGNFDNLTVAAGTFSFANLTITDGELVLGTNNPTISFSGNVDITAAGTLSAGTNPITVSGNWTNAGTFNHGNGKIIFAGTVSKIFTPGNSAYNNIELNKTAASSSAYVLTVSGTATVSGSIIHTDGRFTGGQMNLAGNYTIAAAASGGTTVINFNHASNNQTIVYSASGVGAQLSINKAGGNLTVDDDIIINGWTYAAGTVVGLDAHTLIFGGGESGSFTPGSLSYSNIELNKTAASSSSDILTTSGTATISGNITHTNGRLIGGQMNLAGNYTIAAAASGGTTVINFNHASNNQSIVYSTDGIGANVRIDKAAGNFTTSGDIVINGWEYVAGTVIGVNSYAITFSGENNGNFIPGALTYGSIGINKTHASIVLDELIVGSGTLDISGDLTVIDGELRLNTNNPAINLAGNLSLAAVATFTHGTNPLTFIGTVPSTFTDSSATPQDIGKLALSKTNADASQNKLTLASNMTCDIFSVSDNNTFDLGNGGYILILANAGNVADVFSVDGTVVPGDSTVRYTATNSAGNINIAPTSYDDLQLSGAETYVISGATDIGGNLTIGATSTMNGGSAVMNIAGNLTNSGTFTPAAGTVILDGAAQSLSGNNTFYNLTKQITATDTLTFTASSTTTINGTLTLEGHDRDNLLSLVSSVPDTAWILDVADAATYDFDYLDVRDSDASAGQHLNVLNSLDSGNNTNWSITNNTAPSITIPTITSNGSIVTIQTTVSDTDHDNISLKIQYSQDSGSNWYDPYLLSSTSSLNNGNEYQITGISTVSDSTVTITWDTKDTRNELSSILYEDDIKIKITPYDNTDIGTARTSASFIVNNRSAVFILPVKPDPGELLIVCKEGALSFENLPENVTEVAISSSPDFTDASFENVSSIIDVSSLADTIYLKFRTTRGAVSDVVTFDISSGSTTALLNEGDIVKTKDSFDVYIIKYMNGKKFKRLILSPSVFSSYQHLKWSNLKTISQEQMNSYITSSLVQVKGDQNLYELTPLGDTGKRRVVGLSENYDRDSIYEINAVDRDSYILE